MPRISGPMAIALFAISGVLPAQADTRGTAPHLHGQGTIQLIADGTELAIDLTAPGADLFGFEHSPHSPEEISISEDVLRRLAEPLALFVPDAACTVISTDIDAGALAHSEAEEDHDHGDDHDHGGDHANLHAQYRFECDRPVQRLDLAYCQAFPAIELLAVQGLVDGVALIQDVHCTDPQLVLRQ